MRILFLIACSTLFLKTIAQDSERVIWALRLGYSANQAVFKIPQSQATQRVDGGYFGLQLKIPFDNRLYFNPFIDLHYRGMEVQTPVANEFSSITEAQIRVATLLHLQLTGQKNKPGGLFIQAGPSFGFGVWGRQTRQNNSNTSVTQKLKYGFQAYGRYDFTLHAGLGIETRGGFQLHVNYNHGLSNMINTEFGPILKYRYLSAGIGIPIRK